MSSQSDPSSTPRPTRAQRRRMGWTIRITPAGVLLLVLINLLILVGWGYGISQLMTGSGVLGQANIEKPSVTPTEISVTYTPAEVTVTSQATASPTVQPSDTSTPNPATASPQPLATLTLSQGLIILALDEGGRYSLVCLPTRRNRCGTATTTHPVNLWPLG